MDITLESRFCMFLYVISLRDRRLSILQQDNWKQYHTGLAKGVYCIVTCYCVSSHRNRRSGLYLFFSAWIHESATDAVKIFNRRAEAVSGLAVSTAEDLQV